MMIEFQCQNLVFNPALGFGEPCGHRMIVPDSSIGEQVECGQCHQPTEVPFDNYAAKKRPSPERDPSLNSNSKAPRSNPAKSNLGPKSMPPVVSKSSTTTSQQSSGKSPRTPATTEAKKDELNLLPPTKRTKADLSALVFGDESPGSKRQLATDNRVRCTKCGEVTGPQGRCPACGFSPPKFEKATQPLSEIKTGLAGFQLWIVETLSETIPFRYLEYGSHVAIAFIVTLLSLVALVRMPPIASLGLVSVMVFFAVFYIALIWKGHRLARDPQARLSWYQRPLWNLVLRLARCGNWQSYDQRFQGRKIIDQRGEGITDDHLSELPGLNLCEVLDLENTLISDRGLRQLYGLQNLHCVVLRKTKVTQDGVFRLQQTHPKLWIWD